MDESSGGFILDAPPNIAGDEMNNTLKVKVYHDLRGDYNWKNLGLSSLNETKK